MEKKIIKMLQVAVVESSVINKIFYNEKKKEFILNLKINTYTNIIMFRLK